MPERVSTDPNAVGKTFDHQGYDADGKVVAFDWWWAAGRPAHQGGPARGSEDLIADGAARVRGVSQRRPQKRAGLRLRAIARCFFYGLVPWRLYERRCHFRGMSYGEHAALNLRLAGRWATGGEDASDVRFEEETNGERPRYSQLDDEPDWECVVCGAPPRRPCRWPNGRVLFSRKHTRIGGCSVHSERVARAVLAGREGATDVD